MTVKYFSGAASKHRRARNSVDLFSSFMLAPIAMFLNPKSAEPQHGRMMDAHRPRIGLLSHLNRRIEIASILAHLLFSKQFKA